jgi:predicted Zn-dependent protease with MMP-like domain
MAHESGEELPWEELFARADKVVQETIASLPGPIREQAQSISTLLDKWPRDEEAPDMLGQFHGFEPGHLSETLGPIFLFLGPICQMCEEENLSFDEEVRSTYLHELGHHLGLDEDDLDERGLS